MSDDDQPIAKRRRVMNVRFQDDVEVFDTHKKRLTVLRDEAEVTVNDEKCLIVLKEFDLWKNPPEDTPLLSSNAAVGHVLAKAAFCEEWIGTHKLHTPHAYLVISMAREAVDAVLAVPDVSATVCAYTVAHLALALREVLLAQGAMCACLCKAHVVRVGARPVSMTEDKWDTLFYHMMTYAASDGVRVKRNETLVKIVTALCVVPTVFTREGVQQTLERMDNKATQHRQNVGELAKRIEDILAS